jgi:xanthine phosphoribosyltransferase
MNALQERILKEGKVLGGGILKVDSFVNHQVDPKLMDDCGRDFAKRFANVGATKILTAEISGIAPAFTTAIHLNLPVVYARKTKPITMPDQVYLTLAPSHTKGRMVELIVSPEYLANNEKVLIIDDFLASGQTILGLPFRRSFWLQDRWHWRADRKDLRRRARCCSARWRADRIDCLHQVTR